MNDKIEKLQIIEDFFEKFKLSLKNDLNLYENITDDEYQEILTTIIKEYQSEFYNDFSEIFIYNYYQNLLNNSVVNQIIEFVSKKAFLNNEGKSTILTLERAACQDAIYIYNFESFPNENNVDSKFISKITGEKIPINYQASQIITNNDIFLRPPKGNPILRGPHISYDIEYSLDYWVKFKEEITKYIKEFETSHTIDYLDDLKDYKYWVQKHRAFINLLNQKNILKQMKEREKHVKN